MSGRDVLGIALAYGLGCLCVGDYVGRWRDRARVELAGLLALAPVILVVHRDNLRAALRPASATS